MLWLFLVGICIISISLILESKVSTLCLRSLRRKNVFHLGRRKYLDQGRSELHPSKTVFNHLVKSAEIEFVSGDHPESDP